VPATATDAEAELLGLPGGGQTIYHPGGCDKCNHTGYRGRTGIYELIEVDDQLRSLIHGDASEHDMLAQARRDHPGILEDGRRRVLAGETSIEEVMRVISAG